MLQTTTGQRDRSIAEMLWDFRGEALWVLVGVVLLVAIFKSSDALASAYGIAVTGTMLITTLLTFFVVRYAWHGLVGLASRR